MNSRLAAIEPSLIRELNARKKPTDIDLGLGEPALKPSASTIQAAADRVAEHGCPYGPNAGLPELREAIVRRYGYPRFDTSASVCVTSGSQEALYLAIKALCDPARDELLVVEPAYPVYRKIAQLEGLVCRTVAMSSHDGFALRAAPILGALTGTTRLIVLSSPCNPSGRVMASGELVALAEGLSERPDPPYLLLDEAYRELALEDRAPDRWIDLYPRTLLAGSLSKSNAMTGMRLGWLVGPPDVLKAAITVHQLVLSSASTFSQFVALEVFHADLLGAHRDHYRQQWEVFRDALETQGLEYIRPEGGFYALVALPEHWAHDGVQAAFALQAEGGVVAIPGVAFGDCTRNWLRTTFVAPSKGLQEGAARMARFFAETRSPWVTAQ
ncbi:MAG: pyridoxal phosphate-dependent aminotransferase [Cyanobacteria bacterium REEB65]|nr:pyridoxal phosphate-dependent aminotransferase [Cyanobacteria bacterium REEB65]